MSTYIDLDVWSKLSDQFLKSIRLIFIFGHTVSEVLVVTEDDDVFGFGQNDSGVLGLGHSRPVKEPTIVEELCKNKITKFVNGLHHMMALTKNGKIYCWGRNDYGTLGNGNRNGVLNRPQINEYLTNEFIVDMSCGAHHSLVLTKTGQVFSFGDNSYGQIGNQSEQSLQLIPFKLISFIDKKVVAISCGFCHSLALTDNGHVFSWGDNTSGQLGVDENNEKYSMFRTRVLKKDIPTPVKVRNDNNKDVFIKKICCGPIHSMLLSKDGNIYLFGDNRNGQIGDNNGLHQIVPQKLNSSLKYKDIASHFLYNISIALSVNDIYYIWGRLGEVIRIPKETELETIEDIFLRYHQITYKTIKVMSDFEKIINLNVDIEEKQISYYTFQKIDHKIRVFNVFLLQLTPNVIAKYKQQVQMKLNLGENVKFSFSFFDRDNEWPHHTMGINTLIVSQENKVYAYGTNNNGLIDFGNKIAINEPIVINELSQKGIVDFAYGVNHVIARTDKNRLYIWGYNKFGQLGNEGPDCFVPHSVVELEDKNIFDICCGHWHSLALTENSEVYAWGWNVYGQIGNECDNDYQPIPVKIQTFDEKKVIAISCGAYHSLALTSSGRVYSWGFNYYGQLGFTNTFALNAPKKITFKNESERKIYIKKISCGFNYSLLLADDGDIYAFGSNNFGQLANDSFVNHFIPTKIESQHKFTEIAAHYDCYLSVALSTDGKYYIWGQCGQQIITNPKETQIDSFNKIFLNFCDVTYKQIQRSLNSNRSMLENEQNASYFPKRNGIVEFGVISSGSYGIVTKAKKEGENEICAIKKIGIKDKSNDEFLFRELQILSKLQSDYVVELKSYWVDDNYLLKDSCESYKNLPRSHLLFNPQNQYLLHIQMEYCYNTLNGIIKQLNAELNQKVGEVMEPIGYYIASELLIEILESVDYIHTHVPPIIHRDLKPNNILIAFKTEGRFVKIADFGLAKIQESESQPNSSNVGTINYMAPEVLIGKGKYDTKADVYSLGKIIPELFNIGIEKAIDSKNDFPLREKYENLSKWMNSMLETEPKSRPDCQTILKEKALLSLSINDLKNDTKFSEICNQSSDTKGIEKFKENFHSVFIKRKFQISNQLA